MTLIQAVILGIVQGLSEFLPISSSGHLVLFQKMFGLTEGTMFFTVILHIGTLIPVLIVYRKDILNLIKNPFQKYTYLIIIGTLPAVIFALLFENAIETLFIGGQLLGIGFLFTGLILTIADKMPEGHKSEKEITYLDALLVGCAQGLATLPAVSRSGSTLAGALSRKITREEAAKFSFLLSIPAILGALVLEVLKMIISGNYEVGVSTGALFFGFFSAMLSGYLAINVMLYIIKKAKLKYFAYYVFIIGGLVIADQLVLHIYF